ncbi:MAG: hypothetical protein ACO1N0_07730 [Fluviicola sp.]
MKLILSLIMTTSIYLGYSQCDTLNLKKQFLKGPFFYCPIDSSIKFLTSDKSSWEVVASRKLKKKGLVLSKLEFCADTTIIIHGNLGVHKIKLSGVYFEQLDDSFYAFDFDFLGSSFHINFIFYDKSRMIFSLYGPKRIGKYMLSRLENAKGCT